MQLTLDLQAGLAQRYRSLREVLQWCALNGRGGVASIAAAIDMSPSELARKLAGNELDPHRTLDVDAFVRILEATGDYTPIYWLIEKFLPSEDQKRQAAVDQLAALMPQIAALLNQAGPVPGKGSKR